MSIYGIFIIFNIYNYSFSKSYTWNLLWEWQFGGGVLLGLLGLGIGLGEVVLHSPFSEKGIVGWQASFFAILSGNWLECNGRVFRDMENSRE